MKPKFTLVWLAFAGTAFAQGTPGKPPADRVSATKSAIGAAQGWRGSETGEQAPSMDENALRQSGGSVDQAVEKTATENVKGGGSSENIMNELEKELTKQMPGFR